MKTLLFLLVRTYPLWALALFFVFLELGWYLRRKKSKNQYYCWMAAFFLFVTTSCWVFFRGDLHSDTWVWALFGRW